MVGILCDRALDTIGNPRIVSIKERTLWWNFGILYVEGKSQQAADALSRKKFSSAASVCRLQVMVGNGEDSSDSLGLNMSASLASLTSSYGGAIGEPRVITWESLQQECKEDSIMVNLADQIRRGFPDSGYDVNPAIREFHKFRHGLCVIDGVPCYKTRIVIPAKLRRQILAVLHSAHQGVSGMTARVEQTVFWPSITRDISRDQSHMYRVSQDSSVSTSSATSQPTITGISFPVASLRLFFSAWKELFGSG